MECEGYEYDILLNTDNSILRHFSEMQIEYHHGYLDLKRKLEMAGFKVKKTCPRIIKNETSKLVIGILFAERIN